MLDLTGPRAKLARAEQHIGALTAALVEFDASKPFRLAVREDAVAGRREWLMHVQRDVPAQLSLIAGDAIHNLRSALDYLMWQLVLANGNAPSDQIDFPIAASSKRYHAIRAGKTRGASAAALKLIDSLRPYRGGNDALWQLHRLDALDKHRLLLTVLVTRHSLIVDTTESLQKAFPDLAWLADQPPMRIAFQDGQREPIVDGAVVYSEPLERPASEDITILSEVSFAEDQILGTREPVETALRRFAAAVGQTIETFAPAAVT